MLRDFQNERCCYQQIMILTLNWMKIADLKKNVSQLIYWQILKINRINEKCTLLHEVISRDETQWKDIRLKNCWIQNEILYQDNHLWILFNETLQMNLIHEMHDQLSIDHFNILKTVKVIRWYYYWFSMQKTVNHYIRNCYICQHLKTSWNKFNELLHSLLIFKQQWRDIVMNFIIDLSSSDDYNAILTVVCKLLKKRHYISCITDDENITAERTAELLIQWIYWTHDLFNFIVFNQDLQFIFILWKSFCKHLNIFLRLFTVYHSQINDQSKWANQNVEKYLHFFCSYMQNDWFKWLFMIKFVNNNIMFSIIFLISFFLNKNFLSHMSFDSDFIEYKSTRERL